MDFDVEVKYQKGSDNTTADYFSRHPVTELEPADEEEAEETSYQVRVAIIEAVKEAEYPPRLVEVKKIGEVDAKYQTLLRTIKQGFPGAKKDVDFAASEYWNYRTELSVREDGYILLGTRLVIPKEMRS